MLDFPSEKHVVLLDAVIWREHLRPFLFHVYTPLFYLFVLPCDGCRSLSAPASDDVLQTFARISLRRFPSTRLSLPTSSHLNITHLLAVFPALFVLLLPTRPPIRPQSARLPPTLLLEQGGGGGEEKKIAARRRLSRANETQQEQTHAYRKQSEKRTDGRTHFRDGAASSRLSQSLKGRGGPSRGRPCANEEVGKAAEGGGRESDQMTP